MNYMSEALKMARKAYKNGDVPVGAIIVENNKIIAKGYNKREKKHNVLFHAEIDAINKACRYKKNWHLNECVMYVTLEPCIMCMGAIEQSHIKKVIYGAKNIKYGYNNNSIIKAEVIQDQNDDESIKLLKTFFENKR